MTASPRNFIDRVFFGFQNTATLKAALELDVFTAIGNGVMDADALAAKCDAVPRGIAAPVSYTHLTLPTILRV